MKTKLLKKIRKRFNVNKEGNWYVLMDYDWNVFTPFYSTYHSYELTNVLDWIFEHYYSRKIVRKRRGKLNKTNL